MSRTYVCSKCFEEKPEEDFAKEYRKNRSKPVESRCRSCHNKYKYNYMQKFKQENPKEYQRQNKIFNQRRRDKMFNLNVGQYQQMLEEQNHGCYLCGGTSKNGSALAVDHDHETGTVRRLLCDCCNRGIGLLQDSPELLAKAALYIAEFRGK